jgi:glycosyltransferase involved in cell wall biosynthesis
VIFVFEPSPITVGLPAIALRKLKRIPMIFWVQDLWPESLVATGAVKSESVLSIVRVLVRFIYKRCDRILVQSRTFIDQIRKLGMDVSRVEYYPNSAEDFYQPMNPPSELPRSVRLPEGFRLMFAGNIGAAQDFETILSAAERLRDRKDIQWIILGDGRLKRWVETQVQARGLAQTVHLYGHFPVETMPQFFSCADAMLVTLKRDPIFALTIPTKIQSYLACAKPIIAALDGEGARIVEEAEAGFACSSENAEGLATAVLRMVDTSPEKRKTLGENGRRYFENHFERKLLIEKLEGRMAQVRESWA